MKFRSYVGKTVLVKDRPNIVFGDEPYETDNEDEIDALKKALEVVVVGGDGTDGSGRKVKIFNSQTLEPETSKEADSLAVSENSSPAEILMEQAHEQDGQVFKSDSTFAVNAEKDAFKQSHGGKLTTEQSNEIEENSRKPKK